MPVQTATPLMLRDIPFFRRVEDTLLDRLAPEFQIEHLRRGQLLAGRGFQHMERYQNRVWFVYRGVVASYTITKTNSRKILFFLGPGKLLNHDVFGSRPTTLFAEAMVDSMLLSIPKDIFMQAVRRSPALTEALFAHYETDLWRMSHQLKNTAGYISVERKLAIKLLKLSQDFGQPAETGMMIPFPLTVTQVGEFVGVPRETASRACKKLGELDLIRYENKHFYITDRERLVAYYRETGTKKEELL